jgi:heat shock protein HslJ
MKTSSNSNRNLYIILTCAIIFAILVLVAIVRGNAAPPPAAPADTAAPANTAVPVNTPVPVNTLNPIQNILWQWVSVTNKDNNAQTTVPDPAKYTIAFYPDNTLSVLADCNTIAGTYSQQNGFSIKLGPSTMMACGDASLDQQYITLLNNVAAGGPDGAGGLALETAGGQQRMIFKNGGSAQKP